ncbi:MAG TPA: glucose-6-phosphate dehydrogenase [Vicinamibacterales bacterium]|nr:glucose-6-phosphate dehydrogenase [Vicinamibacterales bacterium]
MPSLVAEPAILVIFGASGDLTRRKLLPAIYNLVESGYLPDGFAILGVARQAIEQDEFRSQMRERVRSAEGEPLEAAKWRRIEERLYYLAGDFGDRNTYVQVADRLRDLQRRHSIPANVVFYFATPPDLFGPIARQLADRGLTREDDGWRRVIIEKPFGYDLESARALNQELSAGLSESQIYRIDHYLGKETVQNILALRFANGIFEPIWNRRYVDHVQMTVAEAEGIGTRGAYYDHSGALRDMVQNHMFQLLTLVAMEPPISFRAEDVRNEKVKVLHAIAPLTDDDVRRQVVRAQYDGYLREQNVSPDSRTETFIAMRVFVDNWRWAGVPFYLRTGKRLARRATEVAVQFRRAPFALFRETPVECMNPNVLALRIQPDEGISLAFDAKQPGPLERLSTVTMDFSYGAHFKAEPNTGYETLLFDVLMGDQTLFHRMDMVEAGWQIVDPILRLAGGDRSPLRPYAGGSSGPSEADLLIERAGREWRELKDAVTSAPSPASPRA